MTNTPSVGLAPTRASNATVEQAERFLGRAHPADRDRVEAALRRAAGENAPCGVEYRPAADGEGAWVETWFAPVAEEDEEAILLGITHDITERRRELATLRRERRSEDADHVAHDLLTPLSVARGRLEMARAADGGAHLDDVAAALDRMAALIDGLLDDVAVPGDIDN